jgi:hypothetical protein
VSFPVIPGCGLPDALRALIFNRSISLITAAKRDNERDGNCPMCVVRYQWLSASSTYSSTYWHSRRHVVASDILQSGQQKDRGGHAGRRKSLAPASADLNFTSTELIFKSYRQPAHSRLPRRLRAGSLDSFCGLPGYFHALANAARQRGSYAHPAGQRFA